MTVPAVLVLDAGGPDSAFLARAAVARGHAVHAAATSTEAAAYSAELTALLSGRVLTDFARPEQAASEIVAYARRRGVDAVLTVNEYLTELAALVCAELGVPGNDPHLAHAARDKAAMARTLATAGVRIPYTCLARDESVTQNGVTTHLAFTKKRVSDGAHRVETGHSLPVLLPPAIETAVFREVGAAIRAVGIRHGASHTEVIVADGGRCTVIEIAARLAAGQIGVLIQHALGVDVWAALLDVALGRSAARPRSPPPPAAMPRCGSGPARAPAGSRRSPGSRRSGRGYRSSAGGRRSAARSTPRGQRPPAGLLRGHRPGLRRGRGAGRRAPTAVPHPHRAGRRRRSRSGQFGEDLGHRLVALADRVRLAEPVAFQAERAQVAGLVDPRPPHRRRRSVQRAVALPERLALVSLGRGHPDRSVRLAVAK
ncbi:ATP-grasp domain-containing protein [Streptomyces sirii]|uniref:ATP-grasp domain-containing protein n=1 Tax=Streptomyces sirii TaxID=3127701 RepID=UPI003D36BE22